MNLLHDFVIPQRDESNPLLVYLLFLWSTIVIFQYIRDKFTSQFVSPEAILLLLICHVVQKCTTV